MNYQQLPDFWKQKIKSYLQKQGDPDRSRLIASDFPVGSKTIIRFDDSSYVEFCSAIAIEAPHLNEVAIFTEHCGYHLFPAAGNRVEIEPSKQKRPGALKGKIWLAEDFDKTPEEITDLFDSPPPEPMDQQECSYAEKLLEITPPELFRGASEKLRADRDGWDK